MMKLTLTNNESNFIKKFMIIYILLQPVIDLLTSLQMYYFNHNFTVGVVIRSFFLLLSCIYIMLFYKEKNNKQLKIYLLVLITYCFAFLMFSYYENASLTTLLQDAKGLIKIIYLPVFCFLIYALYKQKISINYTKLLSINAFIYLSIVFLAFLTGTSFTSYAYGYGYGYKGWFYAANEIGIIIAVLIPILLLFILKQNKKPKQIILIFISIGLSAFSSCFIGTKAVLLIIGVYAVLSLIWYLITSFSKKQHLIQFFYTLFLCVIIIGIFPISPVYKNISYNINSTMPNINDDNTKEENIKSNVNNKNNNYEITNWLLSGRLSYIKPYADSFSDGSFLKRCLGIGYNNFNKSIEMDYFTLFFQHGFIGFAIILLPVLIIIFRLLWNIFTKFKKFISNIFLCTYSYCFIMLIVAAGLAGHVIVAPAVSIYVAIIGVKILMEFNNSKEYIQGDCNENISDNANLQ